MSKFTVEGKEIEAHEHFTANLRLQLISGIGRFLAHECTGCKKMKLADSFIMNRGYVQSKCKECVFEALRVAGLNPVMSTNKKTPIIKDDETGEAIAKRCGKCRRMIIKSSFVYRKRNKDGMDSKCNECVREYKREKISTLKTDIKVFRII